MRRTLVDDELSLTIKLEPLFRVVGNLDLRLVERDFLRKFPS